MSNVLIQLIKRTYTSGERKLIYGPWSDMEQIHDLCQYQTPYYQRDVTI